MPQLGASHRVSRDAGDVLNGGRICFPQGLSSLGGVWWDSFGLKTRLPLCLLVSLSEMPHGPLQMATHSREACSPEWGT